MATDFQTKPPFSNGDLIFQGWRMENWKRLSKIRLYELVSQCSYAISLYPVEFSGKTICWKVDIKCHSGQIFKGIPAEGYVKVPEKAEHKMRGLRLVTDLGFGSMEDWISI